MFHRRSTKYGAKNIVAHEILDGAINYQNIIDVFVRFFLTL